MVVAEVIQRIGADDIEDGIYFLLAEGKENGKKGASIQPFFGLWENFTNKKRFNEDKKYNGYTINYKGSKRILLNLLAAATFAKYW